MIISHLVLAMSWCSCLAVAADAEPQRDGGMKAWFDGAADPRVVLPSAYWIVDRATAGNRGGLETVGKNMREGYTTQVNKILRDRVRWQDNPDSIVYAAEFAGNLRLAGCVDAIVETLEVEIKLWEPRFDRLPFAKPPPSVFRALVEIGKPSIQPLLKVAASEKATPYQLTVAGGVLREVEGELAGIVVEFFIESSDDPVLTRKMLERGQFTAQWRPYVEQKIKERAAKKQNKKDEAK